MNTITKGGILLVASLLLAACGSTQEIKTSVNGPALKAVTDEQQKELVSIKSQLDELNAASPSILAQAQGNEACEAYQSFEKYHELSRRFDRGGFASDFPQLKDGLKAAAHNAVTLGYTAMQANKPVGCGGGEGRISEATMVQNIGKLIDDYGSPGEAKLDPKVFRAAYIRAIRPEIAEEVALIQKGEGNSDIEGGLYSHLQEAEVWHITPTELGVPLAIVKKLNL